MPTAYPEHGKTKRKHPEEPSSASAPTKKPRSVQEPKTAPLLAPHAAILAELAPKYDVLAASVISSTQIRKRVGYITTHLLAPTAQQPRVALLYARTADVCKLITVVEQAKRVLSGKGKTWFQYNQMFELPKSVPEREVVDETVLEPDAEGDDGDDFEVMESRFEKAVLPQPSTRLVKSMRVFLSVAAIPELRSRDGVTVQLREIPSGE